MLTSLRNSLTARMAMSALVAFILFTIVPTSWSQDVEPPPDAIAVLKGHTEPVYSADYSPDGKFVITASFDKTLKIWDSTTGKELATFGGTTGHQKMVLNVAVSPDGMRFATGSTDNTAKLWDFPSSKPLSNFPYTQEMASVDVTPDGTKIAGGAKDGIIKIWNVADGKELFTLKGHTGTVTGLSFNSNGQQLISSGADGTMRMWNVTNGQSMGMIGAHDTAVKQAVMSTNNSVAYTVGENGSLKTWSVPPVAEKKLNAPHKDVVTDASISGNGQYIITASADKTVRVSTLSNGAQAKAFTVPTTARTADYSPNNAYVAAGSADQLFLWQYNNNALLAQSHAHAGEVTGVDFHPSSNQLLTTGTDGVMKLWTVPLTPPTSIAHPAEVLTSSVVMNGAKLVTGSKDKIVRTWNLSNNQLERQYAGHTAPVTAVAMSVNGQYLASAAEDNTIRFWNQGNGQQLYLLGGHEKKITSLSFHPNNSQMISASEDGSIKLWQMPFVAPRMFAHAGPVSCVAISPDGARMITGCADKNVRLWNLSNGANERTFGGSTLAIQCVAFSNNAALIASGSADKTITVWNAGNAQVVKKFPNLPAVPQSVVITPDNKQVIAGFADNSIRAFDIAMGKEVMKFPGHGGAVTGLVLNPKGDVLISSSADKTIKTWTVMEGKVKSTLTHGNVVNCVALSKDGTKIVSGGADKAVKVWNLADGKLLATITTPADIKDVDLSTDAKRVVVAGAGNQGRIYDLEGRLQETFSHTGPVLAAKIHADNKRIITASADKTAQLWTTMFVRQMNHAGPVTQATFSPNGALIVSGSADKMVKVWNAGDGKEIKTIPAHTASVTSVGISADNTKVVSSGADKKVNVWSAAAVKPGTKEVPLASFTLAANPDQAAISNDGKTILVSSLNNNKGQVQAFDVESKQELQTITDHAGAITSLAFHPNNRTFYTGSLDKTVRVTTLGVLKAFRAHEGGALGVAFHNSGSQAVSCGADKTVKHWDLNTGKILRTFGPMPEAINSVTFSRNYAQIGATTGKIAKVWNLGDGKALMTIIHKEPVSDIAFNSNSTQVVTGCKDGKARVWDVATSQMLQAFHHEAAIHAVDFSTNNTNVLAGGEDKTLTIHTMRIQRNVETSKDAVTDLYRNSNGQYLLTTHTEEKAAKLWNTGNGALTRTYATNSPATAGAINISNTLVAVASEDQMIRLFNLSSGQLVKSFKTVSKVRKLDFAQNNQVLVGAMDDGTVQTWNAIYNNNQPAPPEMGQTQQTFKHAKAAHEVIFARDNVHLYSSSDDKTITRWKVASATPVRSLNVGAYADAVAFSPDTKQLAIAAHNGQVRIYDVEKGNQIRAIQAHTKPAVAPIYCMIWSPDGKMLITGSNDKTVKFWNPTNGAMIREIKAYDEKKNKDGHLDAIYCMSLSANGQMLATGSSDRTIKIWNVASGKLVRTLENPSLADAGAKQVRSHPGSIYGVRFTKDMKKLISVGRAPRGEGYLAVWNVADGKLLYGDTRSIGPIYGLALSPDEKQITLGTGRRGRFGPQLNDDLNRSYLLKVPGTN